MEIKIIIEDEAIYSRMRNVFLTLYKSSYKAKILSDVGDEGFT